MMNLLLALAGIGTLYLLDALWDAFIKSNWEPLIKFGQISFIAFGVKCGVKLVIWMINF